MFLNCNKQYVENNLIIETTEYRLQVCFHLVFPHKSDNFFMSFSEQQFSSHYKSQPTSSFVTVSAHSHAFPRRVIKIAFDIDDDDSHAPVVSREFSIRNSMESCSQWKSFYLQRLGRDAFEYLIEILILDLLGAFKSKVKKVGIMTPAFLNLPSGNSNVGLAGGFQKWG